MSTDISLKQLSQKENWAIFVLAGVQSAVASPVLSVIVPSGVLLAIQAEAEKGIAHIKQAQEFRIQERNRKPS